MNAFISNILRYFPHVRESMRWRIQGRGPAPPPPLLFFDQNEARRAQKKFLGDGPSPISGSGWPLLPPTRYLKVWIRHCPGQSWILDSTPDSVFQVLDSTLCQWNLDSGFQSFVGFRISLSCIDIPDSKAQGSRFQDFFRFWIPQAKIFWIPEFGFRYIMERNKIWIGWFSKITGTSVDDRERKSNIWLDQWQSGKLSTGKPV